MAPGVNLWAVRVLNAAGSGTTAQVICGIDFVDSMSPAKGGPIRGREHEPRWLRVRLRDLRPRVRRDARGDLPRHERRRALRGRRRQQQRRTSSTFTPGRLRRGPRRDRARPTSTALPGGGAASTCRVDVDETPADFSNFATPTERGRGAHHRGARRVHHLVVDGRRLQHDLGHQHGVAPRRRHGRALHRERRPAPARRPRSCRPSARTRRPSRSPTASPVTRRMAPCAGPRAVGERCGTTGTWCTREVIDPPAGARIDSPRPCGSRSDGRRVRRARSRSGTRCLPLPRTRRSRRRPSRARRGRGAGTEAPSPTHPTVATPP